MKVVYNEKICKILRITKALRGAKVELEAERAEIEKRLAYETDVIVRLSFQKISLNDFLGTDFVRFEGKNVAPWAAGVVASWFCR